MTVLRLVFAALHLIKHSVDILPETPPINLRVVARFVVADHVGGLHHPVRSYVVFFALPYQTSVKAVARLYLAKNYVAHFDSSCCRGDGAKKANVIRVDEGF